MFLKQNLRLAQLWDYLEQIFSCTINICFKIPRPWLRASPSLAFLHCVVVKRAESGSVIANRSYNIAAESNSFQKKREYLWKKPHFFCGLDQGPAHLEVLVCV